MTQAFIGFLLVPFPYNPFIFRVSPLSLIYVICVYSHVYTYVLYINILICSHKKLNQL